ncbi:MAG: amidohydrolase family protein [Candidatus Sumerlaeota bacterium]|nr:amidohydrolase family protein [Candidatus Sumerlaeota bacterium]
MGIQLLPGAGLDEFRGKPYPLPEKIIDIHNHVRSPESAAKLVELMDAHNVERAVVLGVPAGPEGQDRNAETLAAVRRFPDRFVGGVFADPREGAKAIDTIRHYHREGFRIVKLFPNYGYFPDDPAIRPFFDAVAELGMAVLSHCGWLSPKAGSETAAYYSHPGRFEKLIRLYPDTPFIMAHMGGIAGFLESVMLTTRTLNTYVDCSPGQGLWALTAAPQIVATIPPGQIMWGADCPDYAGMGDKADEQRHGAQRRARHAQLGQRHEGEENAGHANRPAPGHRPRLALRDADLLHSSCTGLKDKTLDSSPTQSYCWVVIPESIDIDAVWNVLPPGVHDATMEEVEERFATHETRKVLYEGFKRGVRALVKAGCRTVFLDGSFITDKPKPNDFDACWEPAGVDPKKLGPALLDFSHARRRQKLEFGGEFFPSSAKADGSRMFVEFFQIDKHTGKAKGIIRIRLS